MVSYLRNEGIWAYNWPIVNEIIKEFKNNNDSFAFKLNMKLLQFQTMNFYQSMKRNLLQEKLSSILGKKMNKFSLINFEEFKNEIFAINNVFTSQRDWWWEGISKIVNYELLILKYKEVFYPCIRPF